MSSCSSAKSLRYSTTLHTRRLLDQYGILCSSDTEPYLQTVSTQLSQALPEQAPIPPIVILDTRESFAFYGTPSSILISRGLLDLLEQEDELAFIIAHEFAHAHLEHNRQLANAERPDSLDLKRFELEADRFAAHLLLQAGYAGDTIPMLLLRAHEALHTHDTSSSHPDLSLRIARVREIFLSSQRAYEYPSRSFTAFIQSLPPTQ